MKVNWDGERLLVAALHCSADRVSVIAGECAWTGMVARYENGESSQYPGLIECGRKIEADGATLLCCGSCKRFGFSGMSEQVSKGRTGYCGLVGFRNRAGVVEIGHLCGEHELAAAWPGTEEELLEERIATRNADPRPARSDAFAGCLMGLAIGDALGFPTEFRTRDQIIEAFGPDGVTDLIAVHDPRWPERPVILGTRHPAGTYSDDTQMTLAVGLGLIEAGDADLDTQMVAIGKHFVEWSRADDNDRAPGSACMTGCEKLARGVPWRDAGVAESKGCGSAMRVAPIGLLYWRNQTKLLEVARASSILTHGHPAAIEGAAAAALLVAMALEKKSPAQMHQRLTELLGGRSMDLDARLAQLPSRIGEPPETVLSGSGLGEAWVAEEAVVCALYCFWRSPTDFAETVLCAVNTDGDSDSIACIAGAISGAFNGLGCIPAHWRDRVENAKGLLELASQLEVRSR